MANPSPAARSTPSGGFLDEGFPTKITMSLNASIALFEVEVTPIGQEGGEPIKITNMFNTARHTKSPRTLVEDEDVVVKVQYPTGTLSTIRGYVNRKQTFTITHPDGATDAFFGYIRSVKPDGPNKEGEQPTMTLTIVVTNWDVTNHVEAAPFFTAGAGTGGA